MTRELTLDERFYLQQKRFDSYFAGKEVEPKLKTVAEAREEWGKHTKADRMTDEIFVAWMDKEGIPTHA